MDGKLRVRGQKRVLPELGLNIWEKPRELGERCEEMSVRKDAVNGEPDFGFAT